MPFDIVVNPGHGGNDPGAVGNGLKEKDLTLDISLRIKKYLEQYKDVNVILTREDDKTESLSQITNFANSKNADFFLSVHINSASGTNGTGFESFIYNGSYSGKDKTKNIQKIIHDAIINEVKSFGVTDRGKKEANYHVLRETKMPALLTENLFINNPEDAKKLKSEKFIDSIALGHAKGIAKAFNLTKKPEPKENKQSSQPIKEGTIFYRVITGSFSARANANARIKELKSKGFESFIVVFKKDGRNYFRVVTGSFKDKKNAEEQVQKIKKAGYDSFIEIYKG